MPDTTLETPIKSTAPEHTLSQSEASNIIPTGGPPGGADWAAMKNSGGDTSSRTLPDLNIIQPGKASDMPGDYPVSPIRATVPEHPLSLNKGALMVPLGGPSGPLHWDPTINRGGDGLGLRLPPFEFGGRYEHSNAPEATSPGTRPNTENFQGTTAPAGDNHSGSTGQAPEYGLPVTGGIGTGVDNPAAPGAQLNGGDRLAAPLEGAMSGQGHGQPALVHGESTISKPAGSGAEVGPSQAGTKTGSSGVGMDGGSWQGGYDSPNYTAPDYSSYSAAPDNHPTYDVQPPRQSPTK